MAEAEKIVFDYKEVVTELIKKANIHTGIWALYVEFGITAANMGFTIEGEPPTDEQDMLSSVLPTAIIPIKKIGIVKANHISNISVDAAKVNPSSAQKKLDRTGKKPKSRVK